MKWTVFALLVVNLGFFAWRLWVPPPKAPPVALERNAPGLTLVTPELAAELRAKANPEPELKPLPEPKKVAFVKKTVSRCHEAGPFDSADDAKRLAKALRAHVLSAKTDKRQEKYQNGYWVLLPPAASEAAAKANVEKLQKKGVSDVMAMTRGDARNAVSLGIYTFKKTADQRMEQIRALGFKPEVQPRYGFKPAYWLSFKTEAQDGEPAWHDVLKASGAKYKTLSCR